MTVSRDLLVAVRKDPVTLGLRAPRNNGKYSLAIEIESEEAQPRNCALISLSYVTDDGNRIENPLNWPISKTLGLPYRYLGQLAAGRNEFRLAIELDERIAEIVLLVRAWSHSPGFKIAVSGLAESPPPAELATTDIAGQTTTEVKQKAPVASAARVQLRPIGEQRGEKAAASDDRGVSPEGGGSDALLSQVYPVEAGHHYMLEADVTADVASDKALLLRVVFIGDELAEATRPIGLSFSAKHGPFCYLPTGTTKVRLIAPVGATSLRVEVVPWELRSAVALLPQQLLLTKLADTVATRLVCQGTRRVLAAAKNADLSVLIYTGTKRIGEGGRANRSMLFARELERLRVPVFYTYSPGEADVNLDSDSDFLMQIPLPMMEAVAGEIASTVGSKQRLLIGSLPDERLCRLIGLFRFHEWRFVYECRDEWEEFAAVGAARWYSESYERFAVAQAEKSFCVSPSLVEKMKTYARDPESVILSPNGTTEEMIAGGKPYRQARRTGSQRKKRDRKKVVGYFGHLTEQWFDWGALCFSAREMPDVEFQIIGFDAPNIELPNNVAYLGPMTHQQIMSIAPDWSVGLIPFKQSKLAKAADPIKIYEYLAFGLTVVATPMSAIDKLPMTFCYGEFGLPDAIRKALAYVPTPADFDAVERVLANVSWSKRLGALFKESGIKLPRQRPRRTK